MQKWEYKVIASHLEDYDFLYAFGRSGAGTDLLELSEETVRTIRH